MTNLIEDTAEWKNVNNVFPSMAVPSPMHCRMPLQATLYSPEVAIRVDTGMYMTPEAYKAIKDWIDRTDDLHKEKMQHVKPSKELTEQKHWLNLRRR